VLLKKLGCTFPKNNKHCCDTEQIIEGVKNNALLFDLYWQQVPRLKYCGPRPGTTQALSIESSSLHRLVGVAGDQNQIGLKPALRIARDWPSGQERTEVGWCSVRKSLLCKKLEKAYCTNMQQCISQFLLHLVARLPFWEVLFFQCVAGLNAA